jgi:hypothetical protein
MEIINLKTVSCDFRTMMHIIPSTIFVEFVIDCSHIYEECQELKLRALANGFRVLWFRAPGQMGKWVLHSQLRNQLIEAHPE